MMELVTKL